MYTIITIYSPENINIFFIKNSPFPKIPLFRNFNEKKTPVILVLRTWNTRTRTIVKTTSTNYVNKMETVNLHLASTAAEMEPKAK